MIKKVPHQSLETGLSSFLYYGLHLCASVVVGKTPRTWREINCEMLKVPMRDVDFEEMFDFSSEAVARIRALPVFNKNETTIAVHTGASWTMNHWPTSNWVELLKKINAEKKVRFIFLGSGSEKEDFDYIASQLPFPIYSLIGTLDIKDLTLVLRQSDYFIGIDSGPANLAHLAGIKNIWLLGPAPHMFGPPNESSVLIDHSGGRHVWERFFAKKNSVIASITPAEVYDAFKTLSRRQDARGESV